MLADNFRDSSGAASNNPSKRKGDKPWSETSEKMSEPLLKISCCFLTCAAISAIVFAGDKQKDEDTIRQANLVLQGLIDSKSISPSILSKANCVFILPNVKKFGFWLVAAAAVLALPRWVTTSTASGPRLRCIQSAAPALVCR